MKKFALVLLGLLAAAMAITAAAHSGRNHGDWFDLIFAAVFAYGAFVAFRAVARR